MTREEKVVLLMAWDVVKLKEDFGKNDYEYLIDILIGKKSGFTSYGDLTDKEVDLLYQEAVDDDRLDDEVKELAEKLTKYGNLTN
jgi:hypothetical protein